MHTEEMLLHVIGSIELLQTGKTLEGLLLFVNVLVTSVEISSIGGVGTVGAGITFLHLYAAVVVGIVAILVVVMRRVVIVGFLATVATT